MGKTKIGIGSTRAKGKAFSVSERFASSKLAQGLAEAITAFDGEKPLMAAATELQERLGGVGAAHLAMGLSALTAQVGPKKALALVRTLVDVTYRLIGA